MFPDWQSKFSASEIDTALAYLSEIEDYISTIRKELRRGKYNERYFLYPDQANDMLYFFRTITVKSTQADDNIKHALSHEVD